MTLDELLKICDKATPGPGEILHTEKITPELKQKILDHISKSIDESIKFDGGHNWWWIESKDKIIVGHFGNGPTSEANARFWGAFRTHGRSLIEALQESQEMLEFLSDGEPQDGDSTRACTFCDMGGSGYSSKGDGYHDDTGRHICPVFKARATLTSIESKLGEL